MYPVSKIRIKYPIILASSSPQRQALLKNILGPNFQIIPPQIDENSFTSPDPSKLASILAKEKALKVYENYKNHLIIAADTTVILNEKVYGKPENLSQALKMLQALSNQTHHVITGVALIWPKGFISFTENTEVQFRTLTEKELQNYLLTDEWKNKAGGYAIQSTAKQWIRCVKGEIDNVVGLPSKILIESLKEVH